MEKGMTEKITRNSTDIVISVGSMATKRQTVSAIPSTRVKEKEEKTAPAGKADTLIKVHIEVNGARQKANQRAKAYLD